MKAINDLLLGKLLDGSAMTPILATVLGCMFGLVTFVILNSQAALDPKMHWIIAIVVFLIAAGGINAFLKVGKADYADHH